MSPEPRIRRLVEELSLEEKVRLTHGANDPERRATGYVAGVDRLGIPPLRMADGPLGVRIPDESATAFPASIALAATFDVELARKYGEALGRETRGKGQDVLLAPGANLVRIPHNGRNFEYFAEDPVLSASFAGAVVAGVQSQDVVATPKHYVANSQETARAAVDAEIDERPLRELYLPSFRSAAEAGAGSVMTAYNDVNGTRMSDHERLVRDVLKGEWGLEGYVVSDWFGTEGTADAANGGLDVEMPGISMAEMQSAMAGDDADAPDAADGDVDEAGELPDAIAEGMPDPESCERFADSLAEAVESGAVPEEGLDDMVARVLGVMDTVGLLEGGEARRASGDPTGSDAGAVDTPAHRGLATRVATRGTVLLENDGVLPLSDGADVAVIGPNVDEPVLGGGGSSETTPVVETDPRTGIAERAECDVTIAHGLPRTEEVSMLEEFTGGSEDDRAEPSREPDLEGAAAAARDADVAVVFVRDTASEAIDREDLRLPDRQEELIEAVTAANDRTVVVVNSSGPIECPWREDVAAILENWYPGQSHGDAVASVLYGDADPGGRLPVTFAPEDAYPTADDRRYPGVDGTARYDEGVFVGYRHFDSAEQEPTYPFGHGRSYADYEYVDADPNLKDGTVRVVVKNTADRDGREVVQVYVRPPSVDGVDRPVRELAGFESVAIPAGERVSVAVDLEELAFARYDDADGWTVDPGEYALEIGRSSRDIRTTVRTELEAAFRDRTRESLATGEAPPTDG
ncbi:glycoside hydrolase family 3 C-terminal domain-containing protein [Natronococcus sp. A-GB1]|uniref:beta-glucosidase n=1 Tax=Natronococcus sp. A-GB1 TaxID=3037648 RepID=UPI00241C981A|nr:glycoside hydrolase family 3 C-terminal domain-containing protein [Natronococcus sp. A-GB1]MDG5759536.1 glycoside hydrolase family 3 C-terminal domain-containing protein [Natronococcus sp. A-GB1]